MSSLFFVTKNLLDPKLSVSSFLQLQSIMIFMDLRFGGATVFNVFQYWTKGKQ